MLKHAHANFEIYANFNKIVNFFDISKSRECHHRLRSCNGSTIVV